MKTTYNSSLASSGALSDRLLRCTTCKTQKGHQRGLKLADKGVHSLVIGRTNQLSRSRLLDPSTLQENVPTENGKNDSGNSGH